VQSTNQIVRTVACVAVMLVTQAGTSRRHNECATCIYRCISDVYNQQHAVELAPPDLEHKTDAPQAHGYMNETLCSSHNEPICS
jgi:hypothetical protein